MNRSFYGSIRFNIAHFTRARALPHFTFTLLILSQDKSLLVELTEPIRPCPRSQLALAGGLVGHRALGGRALRAAVIGFGTDAAAPLLCFAPYPLRPRLRLRRRTQNTRSMPTA